MAKTKKYKPGGFFSVGRLKLTDEVLKYGGLGLQYFSVARRDIETVTVERSGIFHAKLKIIGRGTTLAEAKVYRRYAQKAQSWLLKQL